MSLTMDWKAEASNEFTLYPAATYKVKIKDWENTNAKTGTPQIRWKAVIIEPLEFEGKSIVEHTALSDRALWRLAKFVGAAGIELDKLPKMEVGSASFNRTLDSLKDRTMFWKVYVDNYQGKESNKIDDYLLDPKQELISPSLEDDLPEFLKDE